MINIILKYGVFNFHYLAIIAFNISPVMSIVQFSIFPSPSSQCIVYPMILDCTVNDMLDIKLGDLEV